MSSSSEIPDEISFAMLRKLHADKSKSLDFSNPQLSPEIGDLSFLIGLFLTQKASGAYAHQYIFLIDTLITMLRREAERNLEELLKREDSDEKTSTIVENTTILSTLRATEIIYDNLVKSAIDKMGAKNSAPSYKLVKSLDPSVKPHQINEWIESLGMQ